MQIHDYVTARSGSAITADRYLERLGVFLSSFDMFPERGTVRDDVRPGLRIFGFERSASVAFLIENGDVIILRVLAGGREFQPSD